MFTPTPIKGDNQYAAAHYFSSGDDYYTKENPGEWAGLGAQALGLNGPVDPKQFARMLAGEVPNGERIAMTFDKETGKKRMGLDLTFSAPKSVSMQALIAGDLAVTEAHDRAVTKALEEVEKLAQGRKKVKGKWSRERTGNMVIGKFRHELSRAKDPQLHTHSIVLNMTRRSDGAWRALVNDDIYLVQHEVDAMYKAELARELQALGYAIRVVDGKGNFELGHITRDQIEAFSARGKMIEEALASQGKTRLTATAIEKQIIALATRKRKDEKDRELIKRYWVEKCRELGVDFGPRSKLDARTYEPLAPQTPRGPGAPAAPGTPDAAQVPEHPGGGESPAPPFPPVTPPAPGVQSPDLRSLPASLTPAQAVVRYAIKHLTEREAVVKETDLKTAALRRAVGLTGAQEISEEIDRLTREGDLIPGEPTYRMAQEKNGAALTVAGWKAYLQERMGWREAQAKRYVREAVRSRRLVIGERQFTTKTALKREKSILAIERDGRGKVAAIIAPEAVQAALQATTLTPGQRAAVEVMLSSQNRFVGIQGDAGTGKSFAVKHAIGLIGTMGSASGYRTIALAPYGNQVKALKEDGLDAHTLASFLGTKDRAIDERTIVLLDEAGVVPSNDMQKIMRIVEKAGARMVMLGDTKQTEAIQAGKPFAQLLAADMRMARITEIQRQKVAELKTAVELAAEGNVGASLQHVGPIIDIKDHRERHESVVRSFMELDAGERDRAIIVAGTNDARKEINDLVRIALDLKGNGREFETLIREDMTRAERGYAPSYARGMVIQPERDYPRFGLERGALYEVRDVRPGNRLIVRAEDGTELDVNPQKLSKLSVYKLEKAELSVGDVVRINRNFAKENLTNGDRFRVTGVIGDIVHMENVKQKEAEPSRTLEMLGTKPLHLEHAYASTVHSSQGLTRHAAFVSLNTKSRTTSMNLYYVAISRAEYLSKVFTDNLSDLPKAISRRYEKTTAISIRDERRRIRAAMAKPGMAAPAVHEKKRSAPTPRGFGGLEH